MSVSFPASEPIQNPRAFSSPNLLQIAMPLGGIGAGCVCLNGYGGIQDLSIRNKPATSAMPHEHGWEHGAFALLHIKGENPVTKLVEGPLPPEKIYDQGLQSQGYRKLGYEGLPRFEHATFEARYPFGKVTLQDDRLPLQATITGWSPFIPRDDINSGLPCAILEYTLQNTSSQSVQFEFSYHLSHWANAHESFNAIIEPSEFGGGVYFTNGEPGGAEDFGSAALYIIGYQPQVKAQWFRGRWFDAISALWKEVSSGEFRPNTGGRAEGRHTSTGGSILVAGELAPGASMTYPVVISWYFPNSNLTQGVPKESVIPLTNCGPNCDCAPQVPAWRPFYAGQRTDAQDVVLYVARNYQQLHERTLRFTNALHSSTLPAAALDAITSNLAILKSPTVLRQENGNVWGWEGCFVGSGCCAGSCTHVWNYAQSLPNLFPALERTLREQELMRSMDEQGHINFRAALPDGPTWHGWHAAADGQLGGMLKLYRDYHICGDKAWLESLYPLARRSLEFCIHHWDPEEKGLLFEPHHNTYDIEFWGPDGMCSSVYIGALSALAELAAELGLTEDASRYSSLAQSGAELMDELLYNGEYYQQHVQWEGLKDNSFMATLAKAQQDTPEWAQLMATEGPNYQYGSGCLSDGVIGAWMAELYGVATPLNQAHIRSSLASIFQHNFKADLFDHACTQRPGYAMGHEAGLLLCSWPCGGKPTLPFVYSDEVWTGIEYQVASHLIENGLVDEGLTIVEAARRRYDGHVRNPFNEYECGNYYARAMASYALLHSLSGFRYSAVTKTLWFGPKVQAESLRTFFSTASGFGIIVLSGEELSIEVLEGNLEIESVVVSWGGESQTLHWNVNVEEGRVVTLTLF